MTEKYKDREWLHEMYYKEGLQYSEMAEKAGCTISTISRYMNMYDIEPDPSWYDELNNRDWLRKQYIEEKRPTTDIAEEIGCTHTIVAKWLRKYGVEIRSRTERQKKLHPNFDTNSEGYERVTSPKPPGVDGSIDQLKLHRLVAVAKYGFDEVAGNVVHHKNGIPWDNRPKNLEVMSNSEHASLHHPSNGWTAVED